MAAAAARFAMYNLDAIEAINVDQIATPTDRLLFGSVHKRRPSQRPSSPDWLAVDPEHEAATVFVRHELPVASTVRVALYGAAAGLAVAWISIVVARVFA